MMPNNLRMLHGRRSRMEKSPRGCEEAPKIDRELAQKSPETYLPHVAKRPKNLTRHDQRRNLRRLPRLADRARFSGFLSLRTFDAIAPLSLLSPAVQVFGTAY
jgi:hypothetical protein